MPPGHVFEFQNWKRKRSLPFFQFLLFRTNVMKSMWNRNSHEPAPRENINTNRISPADATSIPKDSFTYPRPVYNKANLRARNRSERYNERIWIWSDCRVYTPLHYHKADLHSREMSQIHKVNRVNTLRETRLQYNKLQCYMHISYSPICAMILFSFFCIEKYLLVSIHSSAMQRRRGEGPSATDREAVWVD